MLKPPEIVLEILHSHPYVILNQTMTARPAEPTKAVRIIVASDILQGPKDYTFAHLIANGLHTRSYIEIKTLTCTSRGQEPPERELHINDNARIYTWISCWTAADELIEWADLLVIAPLQADSLAKMLHGIADNFLLEVLRSWDVSKKILVVPGMSYAMWENPMTKRQLSKVRRKWNWIRVLEPVLWNSKEGYREEMSKEWTGTEELTETLQNLVDLMTIGPDHDCTTSATRFAATLGGRNQKKLPAEIWSIILEHVGDWEVATSLGFYTNLPQPAEWRREIAWPKTSLEKSQKYTRDLEWSILAGCFNDTVKYFESGPPPKWLSKLCVKLIIKFVRTDLLSYLEMKHRNLFWSTFGHTLLPTKASAVFGKTAVLEWWRTSPSFLTKEYTAEAIDSASKAGFVHILDWWRGSGLPMRYTEAALEQASSKGNMEVLDWWRNASLHHIGFEIHENDPFTPKGTLSHSTSEQCIVPADLSKKPMKMSNKPTDSALPLRLKVGKSLIFAAQNGQAATLEWWEASGIPTAHEDAVARIASASGHVNVLQLWKERKGEKMQYDHQVLVGPTKNGHADVLEWWKRSGYRVEYKTCDIEEALEDSLGGDGEDRIRAWWARNGLNLGVGTKEWMKVKVL